ncbi:MAG TPA: hypothetical protein VFJ76_07925 [Solirubrobacterales bacterium]|nr:hypothetical protein [Solirubrobacterales bacterium]
MSPSTGARERATGLMARAIDDAHREGEQASFTRVEWAVLAGDTAELISFLLAERERLFPEPQPEEE